MTGMKTMESHGGGRVLIIVENLTVPRDQRVWNEATTLRQTGYQVSVICPVGPGFTDRYELRDGVHIYRHPTPPDRGSTLGFVREYASALRWERRLTRRVWRERGFDVIHLSNPPDILFLVALPYKLRHGVRIVFDHHDLAPELYESKFRRRGPLHWMLRLFERFSFRTADLVISTNQSFREIAIRRGGARPGDVRVVRNGPDPDRLQPRRPDATLRAGRPYLVGWVGHMGSQAGLEHLVRAAAHIIHYHGRDEIHFLLMGEGPSLEPTRQLAVELGVAENIELTGALYGAEMVERLASCDCGVVPLPATEHAKQSTSIKCMEYMALGLPVVQFDLLESRRTAGDAAVYARPDDAKDLGDKILWLADRPQEGRRLSRLGRERVVRELAWHRQAPELLRAYDDLLGNRVTGP